VINVQSFRRLALVLALGTIAIPALSTLAAAQSKPVASVNGKTLTEADLALAEADIGNDLGSLPPDARRRILVEYLIENQLFADAADGQKLATGPVFDERMQYWRRRTLRDIYFEKTVRGSIQEADAKKFYDDQVKNIKPEEEVRARHILVEDEKLANEIADKLKKGGDFAALAKEHSKDPGSKENGGDLGFFGKQQMVPEFETAAFALTAGQVSAPVKSQFGFHIIKLEEKRTKPLPTFEQVKERILASMVHKKAQEVGTGLRDKAKIDYIDEAVKKAVEAEKAAQGAQPKKQ
jgi:peptidyl-prolyl cis-trans isomerase C